MQCWYFGFEGRLRDDVVKEGEYQNLYSSAMVPTSEYEEAKKQLIEELGEYGVDLIGIEDKFLYIPDD